MKKVFCIFAVCVVALFVVVAAFAILGCKNLTQNLVKNNMSEITESYYTCVSEDFSLSLSVGKREKNYMIDGFSGKLVDFSLFVFEDKTKSIKDNSILVGLTIDGVESQVALQYNPVADRFMFDLGRKISKNSEILFKFASKTEKLTLQSQNFAISSDQAIKIASKHFEKTISSLKSNGKLYAECYLKIMGSDSQSGLFWAFSIITQDGESFDLIISVKDGKIVASN